MFDLHNPLICLNQPLLESPKFIFEYANHECCSRRTMFFNMNHWICLITFLSRVSFVPSLSASLSLTGLLWKPVMHINLCMLGNPKLSNVQQRWLTEGVQEEKPREGERERETLNMWKRESHSAKGLHVGVYNKRENTARWLVHRNSSANQSDDRKITGSDREKA